jgi:hypothetical protein
MADARNISTLADDRFNLTTIVQMASLLHSRVTYGNRIHPIRLQTDGRTTTPG